MVLVHFYSHGYNLGKNKKEQLTPFPIPPKQWWSREGVKTRHFGIIEMGGRGGLDVPFILSKIVVTYDSSHTSP